MVAAVLGLIVSCAAWTTPPSWFSRRVLVEEGRACAEMGCRSAHSLLLPQRCAACAVNMLAKKPARSNRKKQNSNARPAAVGFAKPPQPPTNSAPRAKQAEAESAPFMPLPQMTHVVYQSPMSEVVETDGQKAVIALQRVKPGEVLLVEHVVSGVPEHALNCVLNDAVLFDALHPRSTPWSVTRLLSDELDALADAKMDANGFVGGDGTVAVGAAVSAFNHAAPPRAIVRSFSLAVEGMEAPARMLCVLAVADISPGDEIRIEYRDGPSALHPYVEPSEPRAALSAPGSGGSVEALEAGAEALEAGVEAARQLVLSYSTSEEFERLCVAHDRLLRTISNDA